MKVSLGWCFCAVSLSMVGCGKPESKLGLVTGTITQDGQPVANIALEFHPDAGGRPSLAISNKDGEFEAIYLVQVPGAVVGSHSIRYELVPGQLPPDMSPEKMANFQMPQLDAGVYLSPMSVDIKRGQNRLSLKLVKRAIVDVATEVADPGAIDAEIADAQAGDVPTAVDGPTDAEVGDDGTP